MGCPQGSGSKELRYRDGVPSGFRPKWMCWRDSSGDTAGPVAHSYSSCRSRAPLGPKIHRAFPQPSGCFGMRPVFILYSSARPTSPSLRWASLILGGGHLRLGARPQEEVTLLLCMQCIFLRVALRRTRFLEKKNKNHLMHMHVCVVGVYVYLCGSQRGVLCFRICP